MELLHHEATTRLSKEGGKEGRDEVCITYEFCIKDIIA